MKTPFISAMLVTFAASASAGTPATALAGNEPLPTQFAYRDCLPKERVATSALCQSDAERSALYARMRRTFIFGVTY